MYYTSQYLCWIYICHVGLWISYVSCGCSFLVFQCSIFKYLQHQFHIHLCKTCSSPYQIKCIFITSVVSLKNSHLLHIDLFIRNLMTLILSNLLFPFQCMFVQYPHIPFVLRTPGLMKWIQHLLLIFLNTET
jgi:hypothetical protein